MPNLWVGIRATLIYCIVAAFGVWLIYRSFNANYGSDIMISWFWTIELGLTAICCYYIVRYFGWASAGFGKVCWHQILWLAPSYILVGFMLTVTFRAMINGELSVADYQFLITLAFTTFLIGFSEEAMFRGILLRSALTQVSVLWAMLISAVAFSLLHAVNGLGGLPWPSTLIQLGYTFLVGLFLAPIALKIGNLWPLIIWHWLWDFSLFASNMLEIPILFLDRTISLITLALPIQMLLGAYLWMDFARSQSKTVD